MLKKIDNAVAKVEEKILVILAAATFITVMFQVLNRVWFKFPIAWTDELSRFLLVYITFIAAAYGMRGGMHIGVDAFVNMLPQKGKKFFQFLSLLACVGLAMCLIVAGGKMVALQTVHPQLSSVMNLPMVYVYIVVLLSGVLMLFHLLVRIFYSLKKEKEALVVE